MKQKYDRLNTRSIVVIALLEKVAVSLQFCGPKCTLTAVSRTPFSTNTIRSLKKSQKKRPNARRDPKKASTQKTLYYRRKRANRPRSAGRHRLSLGAHRVTAGHDTVALD